MPPSPEEAGVCLVWYRGRRGGGVGHSYHKAGRKLLCGGGRHGGPFSQRPPLLGHRDGRGGSGRGCPTCRAGGGGVNPTSVAQNDTHGELIILITQMWGGGGLLVEKTFSGQNFVFLGLRRQHPFLHKTKGPTRNPIFPTRPCHTPPPPRRAIFRSPKAKPFCGHAAQSKAMYLCTRTRRTPALRHEQSIWTEIAKGDPLLHRPFHRELLEPLYSETNERHQLLLLKIGGNRGVNHTSRGDCVGGGGTVGRPCLRRAGAGVWLRVQTRCPECKRKGNGSGSSCAADVRPRRVQWPRLWPLSSRPSKTHRLHCAWLALRSLCPV